MPSTGAGAGDSMPPLPRRGVPQILGEKIATPNKRFSRVLVSLDRTVAAAILYILERLLVGVRALLLQHGGVLRHADLGWGDLDELVWLLRGTMVGEEEKEERGGEENDGRRMRRRRRKRRRGKKRKRKKRRRDKKTRARRRRRGRTRERKGRKKNRAEEEKRTKTPPRTFRFRVLHSMMPVSHLCMYAHCCTVQCV